jgi:outer membrane protein TolC
MKKNTLVAFMLLIAGYASAQKTNEFSVKQAVDYAMQNSVTVRNALVDIKIQKQVNNEFTSAAYPQISGSISATHYIDIPVQSIPNFIGPATYGVLIDEGVVNGSGAPITNPAGGFGNLAFPFGTPWNTTGGIDFSQLLFDGQVFVGLQARSAVLKFAQQQAEVTKEQIKVNVNKIYYQLVVGKKQLGAIDANIDRFEKLLNDTRKIFENGFAERLDVDKVSVQLNNLRTEKTKIENQLMAGNAGLKFLLNMPQKETLILTDTLSEDELKQNVLDTAFQYSDRKEYQLLETGKKLAGYNVRRYKLSYLPTVALFGTYSKSAQRQKFDFFNDGTWFTSSFVGVKLSVPIFDGFAKRSRVNKAKLELEKTNNNLEQLKAAIDNDVVQANINITSALLTVDNQKQNMKLAEGVYNSTKLKYEQGLGSNQEIYTAQTELRVAQSNYYGALYDAIIAKIDFLKATGKL